MTACCKAAYELAQWAVAQEPTLQTNFDIYVWLRKRDECRGRLPPSALTFRRYLNEANRFYFGCSKREARYNGVLPVLSIRPERHDE